MFQQQLRMCLASDTMQDKIRLWHLRLGHISERCLVELGKQNFLRGDRLGELNLLEERNTRYGEVNI